MPQPIRLDSTGAKIKPSKKRLALILTTMLLLGVYFAISPIVLAPLLLYRSERVTSYDTIPATAPGATSEKVTFTTPSGETLHGMFFEKPGARFTILLHHGQGGNIGTHFGLAKTMLLAGCSILIYDYRGFGMSSGVPSNKALLDDGIAANNYLMCVKHIAPENIVQCGVSLGSAVASYVAQHSPCAGVILISPYTSLKKVAIERNPFFKLYPEILFPQPDIGSLAFINSNKTVPVLMLHGANDPIIGAEHARELNRFATAPHWLIIAQNAHHGDFSTLFLANEIKAFVQRISPSGKHN